MKDKPIVMFPPGVRDEIDILKRFVNFNFNDIRRYVIMSPELEEEIRLVTSLRIDIMTHRFRWIIQAELKQ